MFLGGLSRNSLFDVQAIIPKQDEGCEVWSEPICSDLTRWHRYQTDIVPISIGLGRWTAALELKSELNSRIKSAETMSSSTEDFSSWTHFVGSFNRSDELSGQNQGIFYSDDSQFFPLSSSSPVVSHSSEAFSNYPGVPLRGDGFHTFCSSIYLRRRLPQTRTLYVPSSIEQGEYSIAVVPE